MATQTQEQFAPRSSSHRPAPSSKASPSARTSHRAAKDEGLFGGRSSSSLLFNFVFAVPFACFTGASKTARAAGGALTGAIGSAGALVSSMSGTMEFQMARKLYGASVDLFEGFAELGALGMAITLLLWVSGLFFGLAFMSVFVSMACLYVLGMATGMNLVLDRVRVYLRDCFILRVCAYTIPVVTVLKGLRFTTGVTVHFPEKSMVWILHAGHWVVRLCWRSVFEPRRLIKGSGDDKEG
eukprot:CAMPEP_0173422648 /NCGR_PEP_ID=MMETSP1357-20121228/3272_1 /TAXON_ID=77926 /ORGANISM="Hemiselmis rufescens, Strain PCC563" /LENGTH=239 /DNA_ID=CAMNT_0014385693 /DNA_START=125 /DNA_END=841 /DNA_ORIENTATION=-